MLVEIRRYEIEPGRRDEFVEWFETEAMPAMTSAGLRILGVFVDERNPDVFYYLKGFADAVERDHLNESFYHGDLWLDTLKDRALEMETGYEMALVRSTGRSPI